MRFISLFGLTALVLAAQVANGDEVGWRVARTRRFLIYYPAGKESTAERAGDLAEKWYATLSRKLKCSPGGLTPIYLYPDRRSFSEAVGVEPGERIVGIARTRTLRISVDASGTFADIAHVIPHELVHVFISYKLRWNSYHMPLWMHEGLAKYLADDWTGPDAELLADAAAGEDILPLARISRMFPLDERKRSIAYVQSYSAVKYMADQYSPDSIPGLLSEIEAGQPFKTALFYSIGVEPKEFEEKWRQYLWEEYSWARWAKFASGLAWAGMGLLAILAFRARILQKRRRAREMEQADEFE